MTARFARGESVRIREDYPQGHIRTPFYIRGKQGTVADIIGAFGNPESYAVFGDGKPEQTLYRIRFRQKETWPDYRGQDSDSLDVEIYEHWLEPVTGENDNAA